MKKIVVYEGWEMECCGTPFKIGDSISWPVFDADDPTALDHMGVDHVDYYEEHHSGEPDNDMSPLYRLTGTVASIRLLYCRYERESKRSKFMIPVEGKLVDSDNAEQWNKDIDNYSFRSFIVGVDDVTVARMTEEKQEQIYP